MKKINILDLLLEEDKKQNEEELQNISNTIDKINNDFLPLYRHINLFLTNNYKMLNLNFVYNISSDDELEQWKSLSLLDYFTIGVIELVGTNPDFFSYYVEQYGVSVAYDEMCLRYTIGNILIVKKELEKIKVIPKDQKEIMNKISNMILNS